MSAAARPDDACYIDLAGCVRRARTYEKRLWPGDDHDGGDVCSRRLLLLMLGAPRVV